MLLFSFYVSPASTAPHIDRLWKHVSRYAIIFPPISSSQAYTADQN